MKRLSALSSLHGSMVTMYTDYAREPVMGVSKQSPQLLSMILLLANVDLRQICGSGKFRTRGDFNWYGLLSLQFLPSRSEPLIPKHFGLEIRVLSNHFQPEVPYCYPGTHMYIDQLLSVYKKMALFNNLGQIICTIFLFFKQKYSSLIWIWYKLIFMHHR